MPKTKSLQYLQQCYYVFISSCVAGLLISTVFMVIHYVSNPTAVKLETHSPTTMPLPEILICTHTPLNITKLLEDGFTHDDITEFHLHFWEEDIKYFANKWFQRHVSKLNVSSFNLLIKNEKWDRFVTKYGIQCPQLFRRCTLHYGTNFDCCAFAQPLIHEKYGLCYMINKWPFDFEAGIIAGARLLLSIPEYAQSRSPLIQDGLVMEYGRDLRPPFTTNLHPKIMIGSNQSISVQFSPRKIRKDSTSCIKTKMSAVECFGNALQAVCSCNLPGFQPLASASLDACSPVYVESCLNKFHKNISNIAAGCRNDNRFPVCEEWLFGIEKQHSKIKMKNLLYWFEDVYYGERPSDSFAELRLYYGHMEYTVISELEVLTMNNMFSQFGGLFGLWLGGSILGVVSVFRHIVLAEYFGDNKEGEELNSKDPEGAKEYKPFKRNRRSKTENVFYMWNDPIRASTRRKHVPKRKVLRTQSSNL